MDLLVYFGGLFLGAFLIQFFIGCRTRYKILRYIPLYAAAVTLIFAVAAMKSSSLFIGLNMLAALVWGLTGASILLGYGAALLVYKFSR